jgi:hypothetical protein
VTTAVGPATDVRDATPVDDATVDRTAARAAEVDQEVLVAALDRVRAALRRHAGDVPDGAAEPAPVPAGSGGSARSGASGADLALPGAALDLVRSVFGLSPFERDVLVLAAAVELDGSFPALCARAHGDDSRPYPTFGLALAALDGAHWSALSPEGALRRWHLLDLVDRTSPTGSRLVVDEYVLHLVAGAPVPDPLLRGVAAPADAGASLPDSLARDADRLARAWSGGLRVDLTGRDPSARRDLAAHAARRLGLGLLVVDAAMLRDAQPDLEVTARLLERTALLEGRAVLVEQDDDPEHRTRSRGATLLDSLAVPAALSSDETRAGGRSPRVVLDVRRPTAEEQRALWVKLLGAGDPADVDDVVSAFDLDAVTIRAAAALVRSDEARTSPWQACRVSARPRLGALAQRVEPGVGWGDLVLPPAQLDLLHQMAGQVRHRTTVYGTWGMRVDDRGLGTTGLFSGPSGTGKTMAAGVLAAELDLDLYRVDLSAVVSKYIGETEKNLRRLFDAAEDGAAVLLFDEADALFGKRSEVKDSHDRYANVEVSYLLQRMEQYRGLAVLTTNKREALDTAFLRRIRFVVDFPFPDHPSRERIWRGVFGPTTPLDGLDWRRLADLDLSGGGIRSVAVNAAFRAAADGGVVRMPHVVRAARAELAKLGQSSEQLEGWDR